MDELSKVRADLQSLESRLSLVEQLRGPTSGPVPRAAPPPPGLKKRVDELHAELSRLSQGVDRLAALEAEVASLKAAK
ncbi:hypothetical protein GCM10022631_01650 [Deinococcus rubellus]|uniref:Uncharacterized protein n=1 Tax=Deinococcus rubellus TaxID=1889240 RepID=A0ABY5YKT0_9DEIO|nr:hypothetical protein [Deinococcus rubellus]UWX64746.1 hypothetical protein N0D28_03545 [Deinococcus rubellus]